MNSVSDLGSSGSSSSRSTVASPSAASPISHAWSAIFSGERNRAEAIARVAALLHRFEDQLDEAIDTHGQLTSAITQARKAAGLSAVVGQPVFNAVGRSQLALAEARGHGVNAHRLLEKLATTLGLDPTMYGEGYKEDTLFELFMTADQSADPHG